MKFHKEIRFTGDLETVFAMLADKAFREKVAETAGADTWQVTVEERGAGAHAVVDTSQSTAGFPGPAVKVLGSHFDIHQEEEWTSPTEGTMLVTIPGKPGSVHGTVTLRQVGSEVVQTVDADIKVGIPLVGGKIEKLIGSAVGSVLRTQESVGADWLAG